MGILNRLDDILKANINALLDKAEDPSKMIDQTLRNLAEDLADVKKETANVMADEKAAKRKLDDCLADIEKATKAAENALKSGQEEDAKKILVKKSQLSQNLAALQERYDLAHENSVKMRNAHDKLVDDIELLKSRQDAIKAKVQTAKAQEHLNKVYSNVDTASSMEAFNKWEEKADKMLDAARAGEELNKGDSTDDLVDKYAAGATTDVDDELAQMKAKLGL
ncbi:MAG: PspA/IM30 family protein [Lachnospiraceae bacterium]|nr:PspA/IM30 family protein [Lachnospiraceae bacterium]